MTDERKKRVERDRMYQAIDKMKDAIMIWDECDQVIAFNRAMAEFHSKQMEETLEVGVNQKDLVGAFYDRQSDKKLLGNMNRETYIQTEISSFRAEGGRARTIYNSISDDYVERTDTVFPDASGITIFRNVTTEMKQKIEMDRLYLTLHYRYFIIICNRSKNVKVISKLSRSPSIILHLYR